jgi:hypothetical protein
VRGRLSFGDGRWYVPYYADIGGGSSATTWQALAGLGYAFGWGDVLLVYRHLEYDQSGGKLLQNIRFDGPALGLAFHF